ncbi:uracil permease [Bacillaceae bacterium Marseille-Q3522]|nr:uracil permease [Bacillaceae bacterium Marseille-Q3522]
MSKAILDVKDKPNLVQWITLSLQHLFAMFGATVLVPYLVNLSPAIALISSGIGTITFLLITQFKVPAYLGSSFAFIAPIIAAQAGGGVGAALIGSFLAGVVYGIVALAIKFAGYRWLMNLLPPVVVGPVIIVIGLALAGTAVDMAMNKPLADGTSEYSILYLSVALVTLAVTIIFSLFFKGILNIIPILMGIIFGYLYSVIIGIVDYSGLKEATFWQIPDFVLPFIDYEVNLSVIISSAILMMPVAIVTLSEHIGHQLVLSKVIEKDLIKDPGLDRSILGDGTATMLAALIGGPPNTTYGENIGVLAITRVFSVYVLAGAAVLAILFGFNGYIVALISSIPRPVMGGVSILLFGIIASSGLRMLVDSKVNFDDKRNLIISSVILVVGIGGAFLEFSLGKVNIHIEGMALAAICGVLLNLILPGRPAVDKDIFE